MKIAYPLCAIDTVLTDTASTKRPEYVIDSTPTLIATPAIPAHGTRLPVGLFVFQLICPLFFWDTLRKLFVEFLFVTGSVQLEQRDTVKGLRWFYPRCLAVLLATTVTTLPFPAPRPRSAAGPAAVSPAASFTFSVWMLKDSPRDHGCILPSIFSTRFPSNSCTERIV